MDIHLDYFATDDRPRPRWRCDHQGAVLINRHRCAGNRLVVPLQLNFFAQDQGMLAVSRQKGPGLVINDPLDDCIQQGRGQLIAINFRLAQAPQL